MQVGQVARYTRDPSHPWWRREPVTHCASAQEVGHEGAGPWLLWRKMDCTPPSVARDEGGQDRQRQEPAFWVVCDHHCSLWHIRHFPCPAPASAGMEMP